MMQRIIDRPAKRFMMRWVLPSFVLMLFFGGPIEQLLLGWIYFPIRVLPQFTADIPTAILGLVSAIMFVGLLHQTLRWFVHNSTPSTRTNWSIRSTLAVFGIVVLSFASGTAMVGATHQMVWIIMGRANRPGHQESQSLAKIGSLADLVQNARNHARMIQQRNNMKQLALGVLNTSDATRTGFPPGGLMNEEGTLLHGWPVFLAGYMMYYFPDSLELETPWNQPPNDKNFKCELWEYVNPAQPGPYFDDNGFGLSHVAANIRVMPLRTIQKQSNGSTKSRVSNFHERILETPKSYQTSDIPDGTSNTVIFGTVSQNHKPWGHPANVRDPSAGVNRSPEGFGGPPHWKGGMFTMCDGSVRFVSEKTDPKVMHAIATPDGGESFTDTDQALY